MPAGDPHSQNQLVEHTTCLGCGCACDDITVRVENGGIVETINACPLGREWFGDGRVPAAVRASHRDVSVDEAVDALVAMLASARSPLVYLAPELSCETQRLATALADCLGATLDTVTSATTGSAMLAFQERGRATATLGEIRNRADLIVFWGVDPSRRYPRFASRYAPEPAGLFVGDGRRGRKVIAVDIGTSRGPADADERVSMGPHEEVAMLSAIAATALKPGTSFDEPLGARAAWLAKELTAARYAAIVADAEPASGDDDSSPVAHDPQRAAALIALSQALNGPTRCALSTLRAGGNRSGADAVLTSQTGYPMSVTFALGFPVYRPHASLTADAVLVVGDAAQVPSAVMSHFTTQPLAIVGPRASHHGGARVAIDTGVAGIHVGGTALRLDDVPLPLRPSMKGPRDPADVLRTVIQRTLAAAGVEAKR